MNGEVLRPNFREWTPPEGVNGFVYAASGAEAVVGALVGVEAASLPRPSADIILGDTVDIAPVDELQAARTAHFPIGSELELQAVADYQMSGNPHHSEAYAAAA